MSPCAPESVAVSGVKLRNSFTETDRQTQRQTDRHLEIQGSDRVGAKNVFYYWPSTTQFI